MSRLASFLTVHSQPGSIDKPEPPAFDWAIPKDKDKVYQPDIEAMCNTLRSRVLRYPVNDIPAQYNSFVLHLLEDYHRQLDKKYALQKALDAEIEDHEADTLKYESMSAAREVERKRLDVQPSFKANEETNDEVVDGYDESTTFRMKKTRGRWAATVSNSSANEIDIRQSITLIAITGNGPTKSTVLQEENGFRSNTCPHIA